jgi:Ca-activated chloride channel homolog
MYNNPTDQWSWFSTQWFSPQFAMNLSWEHPWVLYFLSAIPLIFFFRWLLSKRIRQSMPVATKKGKLDWSAASLLRFIPNIIAALLLAFLIVALARPQISNEKVEQWAEGIDIMLVMDISESMLIEDFRPNRLEAAKKTAQNFINGRFQDRIGLVIFSGDAYSLTPLTTDYQLIHSYIDDITYDMIETRGTAIGSAIAVATNRMKETKSKTKVMILLSDGDNNAGNIDPITAAELASAYGIKIYTIAIGKDGKVPFGKDFFGRPRYVENSLDITTLKKIAQIGKGEFFRANDNKAMEQIFEKINKYEKVEIKENRFKNTTDYYGVYLRWALVCFIGWMMLKSTFISNILQD